MAKDNQIALRINDRTNEAVEKFAEEYDYNRAEAVRIILKDRLAGQGYLDEPRGAITDGGEVAEKIEDTQEKVQDTQTDIAELRSDIDEIWTMLKAMSPSLLVVLLWLVVDSWSILSQYQIAITGGGVILFVLANYLYITAKYD